jgi:hypothetical protein
VPASGEVDIVVVDALPVPPTLLALLEWHVPTVPPLPRRCNDARPRWPRHVVLRPWCRRKIAHERHRWWERWATVTTGRARHSVVLGFLEPRWHLHGARGCRDCGGVCGTDSRAHHLIKAWPTPLAQGLAHLPSIPTQKLSCRRVNQQSAPELLRRH